MNSLMPTYARKPVSFVKGHGAWLWDDKNEKYLDALSGIAVCGLGHAHPAIADTISQQANNLLHTSNLYRIPQQEALGDRLCEITGMQRVFFANSGAEANEAAIKLARLHGHARNIDSPATIVFENSFHGRTMATLTATGNAAAHKGYDPLLPGFVRAPYNDIAAVKALCSQHKNISAILVEPIQGEGGINIPAHDFLTQLKAVCDEFDLLLMVDEVQTGNGRTGEWFAFQHSDFIPDVLTTAKGLGNGMPIGACLVANKAVDLFAPGSHGSTFGGNPLACAVALKVLSVIEQQSLLEHVQKIGEYLVTQFKQKLHENTKVKDIRGLGLMIGLELTSPCPELVDLAIKKKLLLNVTAGSVIRLLPPLVIDQKQADAIVDTVCACIDEI
jgi:acetylornithine aminotransferase